ERNVYAGPYVVGHAAIFLHLVKFGRVDQHQRVLLAVDHARLQRAVYLGKIDRRRGRAEALEQGDEIGRHRQADLEPLQIFRLLDRLGPGGDLAEAVVITIMDDVEADLLGEATQMGAELALHRRPDVIVTEEGIADPEDAAGRVFRREQVERQRVHLEGTGDRLRNHRGVATENTVRVKRDVEPAAAFLLDLLHGFARANGHRVAVRERGTAFVGELGRMGRPAQKGGSSRSGRGEGGAGEQRSARQLHRHLL